MRKKTIRQAIAVGLAGFLFMGPLLRPAVALDKPERFRSGTQALQTLEAPNRLFACAAASDGSAEALSACIADMQAELPGDFAPAAWIAAADGVSDVCREALLRAGMYAALLGTILLSGADTGSSGVVEVILIGQTVLVLLTAVQFCLTEPPASTTTTTDTSTTTTVRRTTTTAGSTSTTTSAETACLCSGGVCGCEAQGETQVIPLNKDYQAFIDRNNIPCDVFSICDQLCEDREEAYLYADGQCGPAE